MNDLDWELLDRYLSGGATPAERQQFERWLGADPDRAAVLEALRKALAAVERDVTAEELEAVWRGVAERTGVRSSEFPVRKVAGRAEREHFVESERRFGGWISAGGLAAALAVLTAGLFIAQHLWTSGKRPTLGAEERVVSVPRGKQITLHLPDGSEVLLGAGSTLRQSKEFGERLREVSLEGQAYFTVRHEDARPFRVQAGDLVATDLGTEFLVKAYPEQLGARVVVRSGSVEVRPTIATGSNHPGATVRPGQLGRLSEDGAPVVELADTAAYFAWTTGTLVLDGEPLRDALPQLSRWYDLDFRLADTSLGSIQLSGRLDQTLTPSRLDLIARSIGLEQVRQGRQVTLYRSGAAPK